MLSLGKIRRLDLLTAFTAPITIVDLVAEEALGAVRAWLDASPKCRLDRRDHRQRGPAGETREGLAPPSDDLGVIAVDEYATCLARRGDTDTVPLVLFEDPDVLTLRIATLGRVHMMNTGTLLTGLEQLGCIKDAKTTLGRIIAQHATPAFPPGRPGPGTRDPMTVAEVVAAAARGIIGHREAMRKLHLKTYAEFVDTMHVNGRRLWAHAPRRMPPETLTVLAQACGMSADRTTTQPNAAAAPAPIEERNAPG